MSKMLSSRKVTFPDGSSSVAVVTIKDPYLDHFAFLKVTPMLPLSLLNRMAGLSCEASVLFWVLSAFAASGRLNGAGWMRCKHTWVTEDLNMHERTVRRSFRKLVEAGLIEQIAPRDTVYRINPELALKGSLKRITEKYAGVPLEQQPVDYPDESVRKLIRAHRAEAGTWQVAPKMPAVVKRKAV